MRVIAGTLRGRKLSTVKSLAVRPTTDRAKQVIFDVLTTRIDLEDTQVLDLFAGSGSLGIEAISRGAAAVHFVERSSEALQMLEKNVRTLGIERQCTFLREDMYRFLRTTRQTFDVVFADPPYELANIETLAETIAASGVLAPGGWLVMEHRSSSHVEPDRTLFTTIRKVLGQTIALIMQYTPGRSEAEE
jgi:16S rRNA (guanine(966)-N(2))-methyltransferase RsmD